MVQTFLFDNYEIKINCEAIAGRFKQNVKFPIIVIDVESYHLQKEHYVGEDYHADLNDKPFLIGATVVRSEQELLNLPPRRLDNYQHFLSWKRHDKQNKLLRKFSTFLSSIISFNDVQTIVAAGKAMEASLIDFFKQNQLWQANNLPIFDVYELIEQNSNKAVNFALYDNDTLVRRGISHELLKIIENQQKLELINPDNENKEMWNAVWRQMDDLYSMDNLTHDVHLKAFQKENEGRIVEKNHDDIFLTILVLQFVGKLVKGNDKSL